MKPKTNSKPRASQQGRGTTTPPIRTRRTTRTRPACCTQHKKTVTQTPTLGMTASPFNCKASQAASWWTKAIKIELLPTTLAYWKNRSRTKCLDLAKTAPWRKEEEIRKQKLQTMAHIWTWFSKVTKLDSRSRSLARINAWVWIWTIQRKEGMSWKQKLKNRQTLACRTY